MMLVWLETQGGTRKLAVALELIALHIGASTLSGKNLPGHQASAKTQHAIHYYFFVGRTEVGS